jgi:RNA polymerase primary sigma factor
MSERQLIKLAKKGDKLAIEKLINAHYGFIYKCALKYSNYGIPIEDLVSEGILALIQAIKKFDLRKKVKLLTFAAYYIENAMRKITIEQSHAVRITLDYKEKIDKIFKIIEEFKLENKREPTIEEIAKILNIRPESVRKVLNEYRGEFSFDEENEENERPTEETFEDPKQSKLNQIVENELNFENVLNLMKRILNEREFKIITEYYGILGEKKTFEDLAKELNLSKERVRQIKEKAIRRLRFIYGDIFKELFHD